MIHVLASDHAVEADDNYWWSVDTAAEAARAGRLVTFGITPTAPETGYGYIEAGAELGNGVRSVARFVEKPDRATAEKMLAAGGYYWNSGTFMLGRRELPQRGRGPGARNVRRRRHRRFRSADRPRLHPPR